MKYCETHFIDYISSNKRINLHDKLSTLYEDFPKDLDDLGNLIFYGPKGVGKYTQMLSMISRYSPSGLKYEKKMSITFNKQQYNFKISDIHIEIDMALLGCNSKILWNELYGQIIDVVSAKTKNTGIIVCKNFHDIHLELLEVFYSYMQKKDDWIVLKFILLTEQLSFIPDNILNSSEIIYIPRPTKTNYNKCLKNKLNGNIKMHEITNIKNLHKNIQQLTTPNRIICNKIIKQILEVDNIKFLQFRDILYDIFIYNLDISDCIWDIISYLIINKKIKDQYIPDILIKLYIFLKYYNNNYRPIYHLENYMFYLTSKVHEFPESQ